MTMHILERDTLKQNFRKFWVGSQTENLLLTIRPKHQKYFRLSSRIAETTIGISYKPRIVTFFLTNLHSPVTITCLSFMTVFTLLQSNCCASTYTDQFTSAHSFAETHSADVTINQQSLFL